MWARRLVIQMGQALGCVLVDHLKEYGSVEWSGNGTEQH